VLRRLTLSSIAFARSEKARRTLACAILVGAATALSAFGASGDPNSDAESEKRRIGGSQNTRAQADASAVAGTGATSDTATGTATSGTGRAKTPAAIWGEECISRRSDEFTFDGGDPRAACVQRINDFRAELGLSPLARWTAGERCADATAKKAADTGKVHPSLPPECEQDDRRRAENTCPGYASIKQTLELCMVQMWCEGPSESGEREVAHGHHQNMTRDYTQVACGFYEDSDGKVWQIQQFR